MTGVCKCVCVCVYVHVRAYACMYICVDVQALPFLGPGAGRLLSQELDAIPPRTDEVPTRHFWDHHLAVQAVQQAMKKQLELEPFRPREGIAEKPAAVT